jgi:hypothetical protein
MVAVSALIVLLLVSPAAKSEISAAEAKEKATAAMAWPPT